MTTDRPFEPLSGSPASLEELAGAAARAASALSALRADLIVLDRSMMRHRSGAVDAAREAVTALIGRGSLCYQVLRESAQVLTGRAAALEGEQRDALDAIERRTAATERVRRAEADEDAAWLLALDPVDPQHVEAGRLAAAARARRDAALGDVAEAEARWHRARDAKEAGSRRAARRLDGLGHVEAVRWAVSAGVGLTGFRDRWADGAQLAARVDAAARAARSGTARDGALDELVAALRATGDDPVRWTAFWEGTTPADLYAALGVGVTDPDVVELLAAGLAAWAEHAGPAEQHALGHALVADLPRAAVELGGRADLAAGLLAPALPATLPAAVHAGAAEALVERRTTSRDSHADTTATGALTVAVAQGLAADPPAALDHLVPPDATGDTAVHRARAWFGVAPPDGWPDGGTAVAGLLAAAVAAGVRTEGREGRHRAAFLSSAATGQLVAPGGLLAGRYPVDDTTGARIAAAYAPFLVSASDAAERQAGVPPPREPGVRDRPELAEGTGRFAAVVQPDLDVLALRDVVAATSTTETSAGYWLSAVDDYVAGAATTLADPAVDDADAEALARAAVRDAGVVVGAIRSREIAVARQQDASDGLFVALGLDALTATARLAPTMVTTGMRGLLPPPPGALPAARERVLADEDVLCERFTTPFVRERRQHLTAAGRSPAEVEDAVARLRPESADMSAAFGTGYALAAGVGRQLGE
ncbi:hypothetical protein [Isoptericola sp. AK164]|uniref:hypothetical protein n=1 Tax=Isoptericola sp. AK164 TaxID=3024246 RepID=UPI002418770E|nr:hypothetical protein [Isoptericola sp. AK164]